MTDWGEYWNQLSAKQKRRARQLRRKHNMVRVWQYVRHMARKGTAR